MRIGRTLPPAAAPIGWKAFFNGLLGILHSRKEVQRFEAEIKEHFNTKHCFLVSSGKAALALVLLALKERYPDRTEVIIPAYTCYSVPSAIVRARLEIKLCDLAENSFDFNFEQLSPMLKSEKLLAVIPIHLFGIPAAVERLKDLIKDPQVTVIEDAAQAMGGEWQGQKLGSLGEVGFFSTGRGKAFSTIEGGVILTKNDRLAERIKKMVADLPRYAPLEILNLIFYSVSLNLLMYPNMFWLPKGLPFLKLGETFFEPDFKIRRMSVFQAGLAAGWPKKLLALQKIRSAQVKHWQAIIPQSSLGQVETNTLPLLRFPVMLKDQAAMLDILQQGEAKGLGVAPSYPKAIHRIPELMSTFNGQHYPVAVDIARRLLTLPVHEYVSDGDRRSISALF